MLSLIRTGLGGLLFYTRGMSRCHASMKGQVLGYRVTDFLLTSRAWKFWSCCATSLTDPVTQMVAATKKTEETNKKHVKLEPELL